MKKSIILFCSFLFFCRVIPAQEIAVQEPPVAATDDRLFLAISSEAYPVTPGDIYKLTYQQADITVSGDIITESDLILNFNVFGIINAQNMTYYELKREVERRVSEAYPRSVPSLTLVSTGIFRVLIKGEVTESQFFTAWGLSRLSDAVRGNLGPYSSTREIEIVAKNGRSKKFDLFKAQRLGDLNEDPYLNPGDTIVVYRRGRSVEVLGEVYRPGRYQLLPTEGLKDLIDIYGGGITERAQISRVKINRISEETPRAIYVDLSGGYANSPALVDADQVVINPRIIGYPIVFFEGAVLPASPADGVQPADTTPAMGTLTYERITHEYRIGETLSDAVRSILDSISPLASLSEAYIIRERADEPIISINLESLLFEYDAAADVELLPYDRIIIPAKQFYVSVAGAVENPGNYPYVPNRMYGYYLKLAGGIDPGPESENIIISDSDGNAHGLQDPIQPEDNIHLAPTQVSVSGAVLFPGVYPFVPDRKWRYFVNLAGGFGPGGAADNITVTDITGERRDSEELIESDDNIFVAASQVTVSGAIQSPGAYSYLPNQRYTYYLSLAGGIDPGSDSESIFIYGSRGEQRSTDDFIMANDSIHLAPTQVTVSGAVLDPGIFPFVPNRKWSYFVNLAGGFAPGGTQDNIEITDINGNMRNPDDFIQSDDNIYVASSQVTISGAILNPGVLPYMPNRTWRFYANLAGGLSTGGTQEKITVTDINGNLKDTDKAIDADDNIHVGTSQVTLTGAVTNPGVYPYTPHMNWQYYVNLAGGISPGGVRDSVLVTDLQERPKGKEEVILPDDNIYVEFGQVTVSGAVYAPGSFPYTPGGTYQHYISLAGGFDQERNKGGEVIISDPGGSIKQAADLIRPGDRIYVPSNSFIYMFNTYFPIITSGIAFITTIISIIDLLSR